MTEDLSENYRDAFANHLEAGDKPALLIVDVVMAYLDPDYRFMRRERRRWSQT